jgi:hypothetical protein
MAGTSDQFMRGFAVATFAWSKTQRRVEHDSERNKSHL